MFKVECEGCKAPYQVDERRVPTAGLKMRCPKCGASFVVHLPEGSEGAELPAVVVQKGPPKPAIAPPSPGAPRIAPPGADLPASLGARAPAKPPVPRAPPVPRPKVPAPPIDDPDLDLPAALGPVVPKPKPVPPASPRVPAPAPPSPAAILRPPDVAGDFGEIDLPAVLSAGLPAVASSGLPARSPAALPIPSDSARSGSRAYADLPGPRADRPSSPADLPATKRGEDLTFGEIDLPLLSAEPPALSASLPAMQLGLASGPPALRSGSGAPKGITSEPPEEVADGDWEALDAGSPPPAPTKAGVTRGGGGGTAFGELNLGDDDGEANLAAELPPLQAPVRSAPPSAPPVEDDMEFGGIPQEAESSRSGAPALAPAPARRVSRAPSLGARVPAKPKHTGRIVAGVAAVLVIGGGSLEVLTPYGAFGRHFLSDLLHAEKFEAQQEATIASAQLLLANDTFVDTNKAIAFVDSAQATYPRVTGLVAYGAFVGYAAELRYGRGPQIDAHAKQQLAQVPAERPLAQADLARAAEAAVGSQIPRAKQIIDALVQKQKQNVDVAILEGEVELLAKEAQKALESFTRAASIDGGKARSSFGIARANAAVGNDETAVNQAKKVLEVSPRHVGARLLIARSSWNKSGDEAGAMLVLKEVTAPGPTRDAASPAELVEAFTVTARVHMARSRITQAEAALGEALKIDPKAGSALSGMGEVLYREGRFTDALARFEAGIQADPEGISAKIGAAKTKIALERLQEAKEQLKKLRDARPNDFDAIYWLGRAEEVLGDKEAAERIYGEAISVGGAKPETVEGYVALAQLLASQGRPAEAQTKLAEARKLLPPSASLHRAIGDVDLSAGRYDAARENYQLALKADPDDLAARFTLGVTLRRMNKYDESQAEFEKLAALDKEYPGLALERGLLYEASNRTQEALAYYRQALAKAPDDPDLMLRVGSAEVVSGQGSHAEEILRKVVSKRPNSAEVNHYLGRALLLKGTNLAEALRYLKRAVDIDNNRAEYHLYVGWAANESGQPAVAQDELTKALDLDKGLADAYWQLGVMQRKQGAVLDAVKNLQKGLELRPSLFEAHATLAECFEDENRTGDAIASWRRALAADGNRPEWHYRLGKLLGRAGEGELRQAVTLCEGNETRPPWLPQGYFELAEIERSSGKRADAIQHYRRFLGAAKVDSPYRDDAMRALSSLGAPYEGTP